METDPLSNFLKSKQNIVKPTSKWLVLAIILVAPLLTIGGLTLLAAFVFLTDSKLDNAGKFDMGGVGLLTVALSTLIYSLTVIPEQGVSLIVLGLLVISSLFFYIFWQNQHQKTLNKANPLLNTDLFQIKSF